MTSVKKKIMSLLLVNDKLAAEDISKETRIDIAVVNELLLALCREDQVTIDRNYPRALYSVNEAHLAAIVESVRQFGQDDVANNK